MKNSLMVVIALAAIVVLSGCAPMVYVNPRQLSVDEIITMTSQGVGKDVIKQYINSTHSQFKLTAEDVVKLTQAKVDPDVIKAMLKSEEAYSNGGNYPYRSWGYPNWGSPYYNNSWYNWYGYPYYSYLYYYNYYRPFGSYNYGYRGHGYGDYRGGSVHQRSYGGQRGGMGRR